MTGKETKNYNEVKRPGGVGDLTTLIAVITFQALSIIVHFIVYIFLYAMYATIKLLKVGF